MNPEFLRVKKNPCNTSTSKQLYPFTKANRFIQRTPDQRYKFYDVKTSNTKLTTSFGYGNKIDFQKLGEKSPGPAHNNFDKQNNKLTRSPTTFGAGRLQGKFDNNPGPIYDLKNTLNGPKFSMGTRNYYQNKSRNQSPGPGAYNQIMEKKFRQSSVGFTRDERSPKVKIENYPSPQDYKVETKWGQGGYSLGYRYEQMQRSKTPGPGDYRIPGDFGFY